MHADPTGKNSAEYREYICSAAVAMCNCISLLAEVIRELFTADEIFYDTFSLYISLFLLAEYCMGRNYGEMRYAAEYSNNK